MSDCKELLPCPFCGNKGVIGHVDETYFVCCCNCHVEVFPYKILDSYDSYGRTERWSKEQAINFWNARHPSGGVEPGRLEPLPEQLLVPLDEEEIIGIIKQYEFDNNDTHEHFIAPESYKELAKAICQRFGQREINLDTIYNVIKRWDSIIVDPDLIFDMALAIKEELEKSKKLNPDTKEN